MKTIFKRAAAWLMAVMMIVNCIPVYAQDSATDYSGQEISLADLMTASETVTVTFRIDNGNYTEDSGSGHTHITSTTDLSGTDLQYESWAGVYKVTGTGVVCTYTIPAGTSLSANQLSFPPLSVVNINDNINPNAVTYTSMVTWVDQGGMIYSADTVFDQDTTLTLQLYANDSETGSAEIYSLDFVCSEDNHSIKSIGSFNLGQSVSQAHIDAATEAANALLRSGAAMVRLLTRSSRSGG